MTGKAMITFIGAGPGDPELLTIKGQRVLAQADVVLYAGSLVAEEILRYAPPHAERHDTAGMKLEQQVELMSSAVKQGKQVARLHTGDPSIFGALTEQTTALTAAGVPWRIVPGVSSAFAAAAALGIEFTLPEITQTTILTRMSGRTPVPEAENLRGLAVHRSSLVIFLSTGLVREVVNELRAAGYPPETPVALVYRASWPDEHIVRGTIENIAGLAEADELTHQALIIISPALSNNAHVSHLYGEFQQTLSTRKGIAILALTAPAIRLGRILVKHLPGSTLYLPQRLREPGDELQENLSLFQESIRQVLQSSFTQHEALVCIMASGIVVREIAPLLKNKHSDPPVVVLDPGGRFAVSLLSGHEGGANRLASQIAAITGGQAVITTAGDNRHIPALDILAKEQGWKIHPLSHLANVMAALVNDEPVALVLDDDLELTQALSDISWHRKFSTWEAAAGYQRLVMLTYRTVPAKLWDIVPDSVVFYTPVLILGIGCNRATPWNEIIEAAQKTLQQAGLAIESVICAATIADKANEAGLVEACQKMGWGLQVFSREEIAAVSNLPNPSLHAHRALGVWGVAESTALLAAKASKLLVEKNKFPNVTIAVAKKDKPWTD